MSSALKNYQYEGTWPHDLYISELFPETDKKMKGQPLRVEVDMFWYNEEGIVYMVKTEEFGGTQEDLAKELCERICKKNPNTEYTGKVRSFHVKE